MRNVLLKELQINLYSGKMLTTFLLLVTVFLISLGMMYQEYQQRLEHYNLSVSGAGKDWLVETVWSMERPDGDLSSEAIGTFPMGKVKRPQPLSYFARGVDLEFSKPVEYFTHFDHAKIHVYPNHEQNLFKLVFDPPDLLAVVTILLSLLALLFSHGLFSREKEEGTLKQMLAAGCSRASIFGGKFIGGFLSLWLCFTGAFLVYALALSFVEAQVMSGEPAARVASIYAACTLFALVFYSLGALISAFSRSSSTSTVLSFFVWLLLIFIVPGTSSMFAQQFAPVPSRQEVERNKLDALHKIQDEYAAEHPDENPSIRDGVQMFVGTLETVNEAHQRIEEEYERQQQNQIEMTLNLSRASPTASASNILSSLSLNGLEDLKLYKSEQQNLLQQIRNQIEEYSSYLWATYPEWAGFGRTAEEQGELKKVFDVQTQYEYASMDFDKSMSFVWLDLFLLSIYTLLAVAISYLLFLRYDPR